MPQTSNRLVLQVDRKSMGGSYLQGIDTINANSYMVNKLAVRIGTNKDGVFTQGKLLPGETLWVTFSKQGTEITKTMLLAEQEITQLTATEEVDGVTITEVPTETQYEYVLTLPQAIMKNAGVWEFSLALRHIASVNVENISDVKCRGEWDASTGATQITGTPTTGDFYVCNKAGQFNPDGTNTWIVYALGNYAVYTGTEWVKSVNLFTFDYTKTSSQNTPYNLVVQNSLSEAENNQEITNETAAAFYAMVEDWLTPADQSLKVCCVCQTMLTASTGTSITTSKGSIKEGEPVVGQLALYSNGIALVESVSTSEFTAEVKSYHYIKINGGTSTQKDIFAPTTGGTNGYVLASTGATTAPTWRQLSINGSAMTSNRNIFAPVTAGTSGYILRSNGSGSPSWVSPSTIGGGGSTGNANVFYVQEQEDGNPNFMEGELMFTLFGTATESNNDWSVDGVSGIGYALTNYAGFGNKIQATGTWNGEAVWAVAGYGGWFSVYTVLGEYDVQSYVYYTRKTYPLNKNFTIGE